MTVWADIRSAFERTGYDADTLLDALGEDVHAALGRQEPVPVRRAAAGLGPLGTLIRLFLLADSCPADDVAKALPVDRALAAGILEADGGDIRAALDVRPLDAGNGTRWIVSDLDGSMRQRTIAPDHVLGVGHASLSLLRATPTEPTDTVLDLGTGCGVQAVHAASYGRRVTATDVSERAIRLARATAALNEIDIEFAAGSWFEPVGDRRFDRIVANPPFVVGTATVEHAYRDSGLDLDEASRLVVRGAAEHLADGGTATLLASWIHGPDADWRQRVSSWLPDAGIDAWVLQRDVADPGLYVGTWLRDAGLDPRDPAAQARAERWLDHFERAGVEGIGFGFVYLRRIDGPSELLAEDIAHGFTDPLGAEVFGYFARSAWLRAHAVADGRFHLSDATALERVFLPGEDGWRQVVARLHRGDGPAWQHEIDDLGAALVAGMRAGGLPLHDLVELVAAAFDEPVSGADAVELVGSLVRHGLLLPA